jgi:hypothetical protein
MTNPVDAAVSYLVEAKGAADTLARVVPKLPDALAQAAAWLTAEKAAHEQVKQQTAITLAEAEQTRAQVKAQALRLSAAISTFE